MRDQEKQYTFGRNDRRCVLMTGKVYKDEYSAESPKKRQISASSGK